MKFMSKYADHAYALMRIMAGFMFSFHGLQKVFGVMKDSPAEFLTQAWFGGIIELVCGILIMIGFHTRWAAFLSSGTMAVAYIQFHWKLQFDANFFPTMNRGELAALYCFVFLFLAARGTVKWGIKK